MLKKVDIRPKMAAKWPLTKLIKLVSRAYENDVLKGEEKVQYEQVIKEYSKKFTGDFSRHQHKFLKKVLEDMLLIRLTELRNNPILKSNDYNEIQLEVKRLLVTNQSELYVSLAMYWCEFEQLRSASYDSYAREEYSDSSSDSSDDDSDNDDSNDGREEANVAVRVFSETINRADRFSLLSREEIELAGIIHNILEFDLKRIKWVKDVGDIANKMKLELEESMKNRLKSESEKPSSEKVDEVSASISSSSSDEDDDDNEDKSQHRKEAPISTEESSKREPKSHQRSLAIQTTNGETQIGESSKEEETNRNSMTLRRSIRSRSSLMTNSRLPKLNVHVGQNISPLPVPNPIPDPTQIIIEFVDEDTTQQQDKEPIKQNDVELKQTEEVNIVEEKKTTEEQPTRMATRRSVLYIPSTSNSNQPTPINTSEANTKRRSDIIPKSVTFVTPPSKHKRQSLPPSKKVISKSVTFTEPKEPTPTRPKRESLHPRASLAPEPKPIRQSPIISPKPPVDECLKEPDQSTSNTATNSTSQMKLRPKRPSINLRMNDYVFDLPASLKANFHTIPTSSSIPNQSQPQPQPQKQTQDIIELVNDELMELITDEPMEVDDNNNKIVNIAPVKVKTTSEISVQTDEIQPEPEPEPKPVEPVAYPFSSSSRGHNWGLTPIYSIKKGETFEKHDIGEVYIELLRKRRLRKLGLLRPKQKPKRLQQQQQPKQENTTTPNKTAEKTENPEKKVVIVEPEPKSLKTTKTPVKVEKKYPNYKPFIDKTETPVTRELLTFILEKFADHKHSTILSEVKPDDKIKHLIDLTQLRRRIRSEEINTIGKFHHEVMFMFTNFLMLIDSTNPTRNMVREMLNYYLTEVVPMFEMVNRVDESEPQSTAPQTQKTTRRSLLRKA